MKKLYNEKTLITLFILSIVVLFGCQKTDDVSEQNDWLPPHLQEQMQESRNKTREQQDKEYEKLYKEIRKENWKQWLLIFKKVNYNVLFSVRKSEKWISEHLNEATLEASDYLNATESLEWLSENGYEVEKSSDGSTTIKKTIKKRMIPDEAIKDMQEAIKKHSNSLGYVPMSPYGNHLVSRFNINIYRGCSDYSSPHF